MKLIKKIDFKILILSCILCLVALVSESYDKTNSIVLFLKPLRTIGLFFLFTPIIYFFIYLIKKYFYKISITRDNKFLKYIFDKHLIFIVLFLIVIYIPFLIFRFPGSLGWDVVSLIEWLSADSHPGLHFPLLYQLIVKLFYVLSIKIHNINIGIFLFTLFQMSLNIFAFYTCFKYMKKWKTNYYYRLFILLFFALNPLFQSYVMILYHDMIYTPCLLLYILLITDVIKNDMSKKTFIKIAILTLIITLTRKNGFYVVAPCNLFLILKYTNIKKGFITCSVLLLISSFFTKMIDSILVNKYGYYESHIIEGLSLPVQNIARTAKYHHDIDKKIKARIDYLIDYDCAGDEYSPISVDPVKTKCRNDGLFYRNKSKGLSNFIKGWSTLLFKYPGTYIGSLINNTYGLYYPFANVTYLFQEQSDPILVKDENNKTIIKLQDSKHRIAIDRYNYYFDKIPILKYIDDPGIYTWLLFILIFILKKKHNVLPIIPLILTFISCILAPTVYHNTRYSFPIIFSILILYAFYSHLDNNENKSKRTKNK